MVNRATDFFLAQPKVLHIVWAWSMSTLVQMPEKLHEKEK